MWDDHNTLPHIQYPCHDALDPWRPPESRGAQARGENDGFLGIGVLVSLLALVGLLSKQVLVGLACVGLGCAAYRVLRWPLRLVWRGMRAWWQALVLVVVLGALLTGCQDMVRGVAHLHGFKGDPYANSCAPESLQAGYCVPAKQDGVKP